MTYFKTKFNKVSPYILTFIISLGILFAWYYFQKFYPFSNRTLYMSDLGQQYRGFFMYLKRWFEGDVSMQYSFEITGGTNMMGNFAYYMGSIFNLVLLFFPKSQLYFAVVTILMLKIATASVTMLVYLKQIVKNNALAISLSIAYAFSGMTAGYFFNIIWLDVLVFMPLIVFGFNRILKNHKLSWTYIISLFLMICANFYMAFIVGVFCFFYYIVYVLVYRVSLANIGKSLISWVGQTIISAFSSCFMVLPLLFQVAQTATAGFKINFNLYNPLNLIAKLFSGVYFGVSNIEVESFNKIGPNSFVGLFSLLLIVLFFINKGINTKTKVFWGSLISILVVSLTSETLSNIWHGFNFPSGFPFRFVFVLAFILISVAAYEIQHLGDTSINDVLVSTLVISVIWAAIWNIYSKDISLELFVGNELVIVIFALFLILLVTKEYMKWASLAVLCLSIVDVGVSFYSTSHKMTEIERVSTYKDDRSSADYDPSFAKVIKLLNGGSDRYLNRGYLNYREFMNDSIFYGYNSTSGFTSMLSHSYETMMSNLGYDTSRVAVKKEGGNTLTEALFNTNTTVVPSYKVVFPGNQAVMYEDDKLSVYRTKYATPVGMSIGSDKVESFGTNPLEKISQIFDIDSDKVVRTETANIIDSENLIKQGYFYHLKNENSTGKLTYKAPNIQGNQDLYISVSGIGNLKSAQIGQTTVYGASKGYNRLNANSDSNVTLSWGKKGAISESAGYYTIINLDNWNKAVKEKVSRKDNLLIDKRGKRSFKGTIKQTSNREDLLIAIPFDKGWKYKVNGRDVTAKQNYDDLTMIKVPKNKKNVKVSAEFESPGLKYGQIISAITGISIAIVFIYKKIRYRLRKK